MLFLTLLLPILNIARLDVRLWDAIGQECPFSLSQNLVAYLAGDKHIKACKSEDVKSCRAMFHSEQSDQKPTSREISGEIAILK